MTEGVLPPRPAHRLMHVVGDGLTLDAGPLVLLEHGDRRVRGILDNAERRGIAVAIPAGVLPQVWRGSPRQRRLAELMKTRRMGGPARAQVVPLDQKVALRAGVLRGRVAHADVVDASVVLCAQDRNHAVLSTDPDDLRALDPELPVYAV